MLPKSPSYARGSPNNGYIWPHEGGVGIELLTAHGVNARVGVMVGSS